MLTLAVTSPRLGRVQLGQGLPPEEARRRFRRCLTEISAVPWFDLWLERTETRAVALLHAPDGREYTRTYVLEEDR